MVNRRNYYLLFAGAFLVFWFLFKLGGMPHLKAAFLSALADVSISFGALLIAVKVLLPKLFYQGKKLSFFLSVLLMIAIGGTSIIFTQLALSGNSIYDYTKKIEQHNEHYFYWFWSDLVLGSYFLVGIITFGGVVLRLAFDGIENSKRAAVLENEKLQLQVDNLKNQINPHFLFNALNTIYYKVDKTNNPARTLIEQFSSLLRYQLYECNDFEVPIEKELKLIRSYIDLQKERMSDNVKISFDEDGNLGDLKMPPYVLLPLVENCFKHVSRSVGQDNIIAISCEIKGGNFVVKTSNTFSPVTDPDQKGIGLANILKRLELICPAKYSFNTTKKGDKFEVELNLKVT